MKKIVFILLLLLAQAFNLLFASWNAKYDTEIVYLTTESTNDEVAKFTIAINEDECFMYVEFEHIVLLSGLTRIECKFDNEKSIIIVAQSSEKESILFSSARGDRDVEGFIESLFESNELSMRLKDEKKNSYIFTFDMSNLRDEVKKISDSRSFDSY